ncbi:MAG: RNA 2',3'-cyclic phosphodiesterase [Thermoplasmata archaeon]|nr:RNA 2',3'-cyclic phosphodiesterase [Thermoplasmata archaeon]MCI4353735.1 RNA 2',3'-cyclic phosphodiesterase [Thermoplasmata archaeon]
MRLFVGVDVPPIGFESVRIGTPEAPAHLTVLFLGEVPDDRAGEIEERFASAVRERPAFDVEMTGVGAFPDAARPRVVWVGVGDGAAELGLLHDRLVVASRSLEISVDERPFVPHLTLRRIRSPRDADLARHWVAEFGSHQFGRGRVSELLLKQSILGEGPALHRTIAHLPLRGAPASI